MPVLHASVSLLPVVIFLSGLMVLDSFQLVRLRFVLLSLLFGSIAALGAYGVNTLLLARVELPLATYSRYIAPLIEESLKAGFVAYIIRANRVGFSVDAAIHGFAVGAGFAVVENIYYLSTVANAGIEVWIVRGLGTAIMHGGATTVFAMLLKRLTEREHRSAISSYVPAFVAAYGLHSLYNHFIFPPITGTALLLVVFSGLILTLFSESEKGTRAWLGSGFDTDQELLGLILSGNISSTRTGAYLRMLKERFDGPVVVDMLCLIRLRVELSIRAKGLMMMREAGFEPPPDGTTRSKFTELKYLESSIGRTGLLAIEPIHRWTRRDLWQLHFLDEKKRPQRGNV
jgi:protease PrsW